MGAIPMDAGRRAQQDKEPGAEHSRTQKCSWGLGCPELLPALTTTPDHATPPPSLPNHPPTTPLPNPPQCRTPRPTSALSASRLLPQGALGMPGPIARPQSPRGCATVSSSLALTYCPTSRVCAGAVLGCAAPRPGLGADGPICSIRLLPGALAAPGDGAWGGICFLGQSQ